MGQYQDHGACPTHGFALSSDKSCLRCINEAVEERRRAQVRRTIATSTLAVTLLGAGLAWGHLRTASAKVEPMAPLAMGAIAPPSVSEGPAQTELDARRASLATREALDAWQVQMARAEAAHAAEIAAQNAEENQERLRAAQVRAAEAAEAATVVAAMPDRRGRVETSPSSVDHPSWWQEPTYPRVRGGYGSVAAQQRAMTAAGVAPANVTNPNPGAWLPPNTGGHFTTRH